MKPKLKQTFLIIPALTISFFLLSGSNSVNDYSKKEASTMQENTIKLPHPTLEGQVSLEETILRRRSIRTYRGDPLNLTQVGQMLWAAQGITLPARGFRAAPSAGATFPLEIYVVAGRVTQLQPGLYKYIPSTHSLEMVQTGDLRSRLADAALRQQMISNAPATFVISAVYERTTRRYGNRGIRYVYMEVGHAAQNLNLQAVSLGFGAVMIGAFDDDNIKDILDLPQNEVPLYLIPVGRPQ